MRGLSNQHPALLLAACALAAAACAPNLGEPIVAASKHAVSPPKLAIEGAQVGADRKTLRQWLQAGAMPTWRRPACGSLLDPYREHLERRWAEGCHNGAQLWRELCNAGFRGGLRVVSEWAARQRLAERQGRSTLAFAAPSLA